MKKTLFMREVIRDKGRIEHMLSAIDNVEEFTKDITIFADIKGTASSSDS